jgi:membrane protease YdiL (CAAX protease family)
MTENPIMILLYVGIAAYVLKMYWADYKDQRGGEVNPSALPGAFKTTVPAIAIGVVGSLFLLGVETGGEIALGISAEQSEVVWYLVITWICAGVVEEVIFRGYLVIDKKGTVALVGSCVGFSLIFALLHPHLWSMDDRFHFTITEKGLFTTGLLLANSLWWYACRFGPWNKTRSIFPCMIAHAASNLGVFFVKWAQGYVV